MDLSLPCIHCIRFSMIPVERVRPLLGVITDSPGIFPAINERAARALPALNSSAVTLVTALVTSASRFAPEPTTATYADSRVVG